MKEILKKHIRIARIMIAIAMYVIFSLCSGFGVQTAHAEVSGSLEFETTSVLDDLSGSEIEGKPFDLKDYPADSNGTLKILAFIEYCYSYYENMQDNYGLYVYVYNPRRIDIDGASSRNKIQFRVGGTADVGYRKYTLKFINYSTAESYAGVFYKFRVNLTADERAGILGGLSREERVYEVSGIELLTRGEDTATEYPAGYGADGEARGKKYVYTGYADGYGQLGEDSAKLQCSSDKFDVAELEVNHTFYRTKSSYKGAPYINGKYQMQMDTVYFAVPDRYFEEYGTLQRIKAEWYEYYTKSIAVTSNKAFYDRAKPYIGYRLKETYREIGDLRYTLTEYDSDIYYGLGVNPLGPDYDFANWGWNLGTGYFHNAENPLYYLFYGSDISSYDPYAERTEQGGVSGNELYEYIKNFEFPERENPDDGNLTTGATPPDYSKLDIKDGKIFAALFEDDIPEERKSDNERGKVQKGYSFYDFDVSTDLQEIKTYEPQNNGFFENVRMYGWWQAMLGKYEEVEDVNVILPPIQILKEQDLKGTTDEARKSISDTLYVNYKDVERLQEFYKTATSRNETVVMFRFATSNYFTAPAEIVEHGKGLLGNDKYTKGQAYIAQQSVFFDFDVIQLTFVTESVKTAIACVSSPIDIVNPITPPPSMPAYVSDWWIYALFICGGLIAFGTICIVIKSEVRK